MNKNIIVINLKATFMPRHIMEDDCNSEFVAKSVDLKSNIIPFFDKFAVKQIQKIVDHSNCELVLSDDWFWLDNFERTKYWCEKNGLRLKFHKENSIPKGEYQRIKSIAGWNEKNNEKIILIIDEHYTTKNINELFLYEDFESKQYIKSFKSLIGDKRRKALIPSAKFSKYENFKHYLPELAKVTAHINDTVGINDDVMKKIWSILKY